MTLNEIKKWGKENKKEIFYTVTTISLASIAAVLGYKYIDAKRQLNSSVECCKIWQGKYLKSVGEKIEFERKYNRAIADGLRHGSSIAGTYMNEKRKIA